MYQSNLFEFSHHSRKLQRPDPCETTSFLCYTLVFHQAKKKKEKRKKKATSLYAKLSSGMQLHTPDRLKSAVNLLISLSAKNKDISQRS